MTAQLDTPADTKLMIELTFHDDTPRNSWAARSRREDTQVELLAYEIARYAPGLARKLCRAGRKRLACPSS